MRVKLHWLVLCPFVFILISAKPALGQAEVTPLPDSVVLPANTSGQAVGFLIVNHSSEAQTYELGCGVSDSVIWCDVPWTIEVPSHGFGSVEVTVTTGAAGEGTVELVAHLNGVPVGSGSAFVEVQAGDPAAVVMPQGASAAAHAHTTGNSVAFSVTNVGGPGTIGFTCQAGGNVTHCSTSTGAEWLAGGASTSVVVSYGTGAAGTGTVELNATAPGGSGDGWYTITISDPPPGGVTVEPQGDTITTLEHESGEVLFTVVNEGADTEMYELTCDVSDKVTGCSGPGSITIEGTKQATVSVQFSTGAPGQGTVSLAVQATTVTGGSGWGWYEVTVEPVGSGLSVTPQGGRRRP